MFCGKCGTKLDDGNRFCPECGHEVVSFVPAAVSEEDAIKREISEFNQSFEWKNGKEKKVTPVVIGIIIAVMAIVVVALIAFFMFSSNGKKLQKQLDLGQKYLDELEYDQALACFQAAIEIDPMSVDAYLGIIEVYIRQNQFDEALEWAYKGYELTKDERLKEKIDMIESGDIFDSLGKILKMSYFDGNGDLKWWHQYTYDRKGRQATVTHVLASGKEMGTVEMEYDENDNDIVSFGYSTNEGTLMPIRSTYENGNCVKREWYNLEGKLLSYDTSEYDKDGKQIRENWYHECDGTMKNTGYRLFYYDATGKEIKYEDYESDGRMWSYTESEYDGDGKLIERTYYSEIHDENGKSKGFEVSGREEIYYNEDGSWKNSIQYDADGNVLYTTSG